MKVTPNSPAFLCVAEKESINLAWQMFLIVCLFPEQRIRTEIYLIDRKTSANACLCACVAFAKCENIVLAFGCKTFLAILLCLSLLLNESRYGTTGVFIIQNNLLTSSLFINSYNTITYHHNTFSEIFSPLGRAFNTGKQNAV